MSEKSEKIPLMKLGVVKEIVEATGMGVSYAYEDLIFLDHNALLLQFTDALVFFIIHYLQYSNKCAILFISEYNSRYNTYLKENIM